MFQLKILSGVLIATMATVCFVVNPSIAEASQKPDGIWYAVRKGDTFWDIASTYHVPLSAIRRANPGKSSKRLREGDKLFLPGATVPSKTSGITHTLRRGDSIWEIAKRYSIPIQDILRVNRLSSGSVLYAGQQIIVPNRASRSSTNNTGKSSLRSTTSTWQSRGFIHPLKYQATVTSGYGMRWHPTRLRRLFHHGVDLRASVGTAVYAAKAGTVIRTGRDGGYGLTVEIRHANGYTTKYGHLSKTLVKKGRVVSIGQLIGKSGNTGSSTGPHLHFEIRKEGKSIDPGRM